MGNVIGQPLEGYVAQQIRHRQTLHGSGVRFDINERTPDQINLLNSNTSWIKLASGISIDNDERLKDLGFSNSEIPNLRGKGLAEKYVLFSGLSSFSNNKLSQRQGFRTPSFGNDSIFRDVEDSSYIYSKNLNNTTQEHSSDSGYAPMPGIISAEIKALNRGSLEKAFVKIKAQNRQQFDIIDALYMRLGYTVLLEWGNSLYTDDGINKKVVANTVIEDEFFKHEGQRSYLDFLGLSEGTTVIEKYRIKYSGNYDGMLAIISNFSWTFNPDGSYDIDVTLISLGDVIESLKTNLSINSSYRDYVKKFNASNPNNIIEKDKDINSISLMLYLFTITDTYENITTTLAYNFGKKLIGNFKRKGGSVLTPVKSASYKFWSTSHPSAETPPTVTYNNVGDPDQLADNELVARFNKIYPSVGPSPTFDPGNGWVILGKSTTRRFIRYAPPGEFLEISYKRTAIDYDEPIDNPNAQAPYHAAFVINSPTPNHYLRFDYLLQFIQENIIPEIVAKDNNASLFNIDYDRFGSFMYTIPNQISLDPRVCLIRNDHFKKNSDPTKGEAKVLSEISPFTFKDNGKSNVNAAYPLNIYLNFSFILDSLKNNQNDRGDVNLYGFISTICTGLNKALGGINNLEPVIDKDTNILKIIDSTPIPGITAVDNSSYELMLYGYEGSNFNTNYNSFIKYESNFIRNIDLKTTITPEYATMVTVGATANGYVKGTEATAFSVWNRGLKDRFKNELVSPQLSTTAPPNEAEINYVNDFLIHPTACYGYNGNLITEPSFPAPANIGEISPDIIEKNLSTVTEFYKYIMAKKSQTSHQAGTVGFIPFKLGITMDGISGIKIYNKLNVNSKFLPLRYGSTLNFIITGVNHRLQNNDWETELNTIVIPKTSQINDFNIDYASIPTGGNNNSNPFVEGTTYGVVGFSAVSPVLFPDAKDKDAIEYLRGGTFGGTPVIQAGTSAYDTDNIRERICIIALSYIGQREYDDNKIADPVFLSKLQGVGFSEGQMWCGYFQKLVWKEAYTTGNAVLTQANNTIKSLWNSKAKKIPSSAPVNEEPSSKTYSKWWPPLKDKTKNGVRAGDLIVYKSGHGAVVVRVNKDSAGNPISVNTVEGNYSTFVTYVRNVSFTDVKGFASVVE